MSSRKTLFLGAAALLLLTGLAWFTLRDRGPEHHGDPFDPAVSPVALAEVVAKPEAALDHDLRLSGRIVRQCPSAGCWFILKSDTGAELKIEMGDYTPTLPQHVGHQATVEGRLIRYGEKYVFIGKAVDFQTP